MPHAVNFRYKLEAAALFAAFIGGMSSNAGISGGVAGEASAACTEGASAAGTFRAETAAIACSRITGCSAVAVPALRAAPMDA